MHAYEKATSHPHGYLMLDLKPTTHDHHRLKTNVLLWERDGLQQQLSGYIGKKSYRQPPILNAMYNMEQELENILSVPSMTPDEKSTLYSNEYHRFQTFIVDFRSLFTVIFRISLRSSYVCCKVPKFISEFASRFVNKGCDWPLNSKKPIKCLVYKTACEF